jgi:hypothetical protein
MTAKALILPLVAGVVVYAGATVLFTQLDQAGAESSATEPAFEASSSLSSAPAVDETAEPTTPPQPSPHDTKAAKASSPKKPVVVAKRDSSPIKGPHTSDPQRKRDQKPILVAGQILKRWNVPPLVVPKGQMHFPMTNSAAINNDGTRVIIDNHPAVDVWDTNKVSCARVQSAQDWGMGCNAIIALDASHFFVRNDKTKKLEAYNGDGAPVGSGPQIGFVPPHGLKRPGCDFAPREFIMGSRLPAECGIFAFEPDTGKLQNVVHLKDIWDAQMCRCLVQPPGSDFLAYYMGGLANNRQGFYAIAADGRFSKIPGIPSKNMKVVDNLAISPDGRYLAFQGMDRLEVWDRHAKQLVQDWRQEYRTPLVGRFTGDGRLAVLSVKTSLKEIATSGLTGGYINNSARLDVLEIPSLHVAGQLSLAEFDALIPSFGFSANGRHLVVADWKQIALVDVERTFPAK